MAVYVDISDTLHLAYSPLNEKHNVLYNKARQVFNQRYIRKPFFNLSAIVEYPKVRNANLKTFDPDEARSIQPLESLCIVEDIFSDPPTNIQEFKIGEFWDFLFSSGWEEGHSLRVLEGRLHELLVSTLIQLTRSKVVVQHSTLAYAKNKRPTASTYKHSTDPYSGCLEETLLVEFIYFGRAVNYEAGDSSANTYAGSSTTWPYTPTISEDIESSDVEVQADRTSATRKLTSSPLVRPPTDKTKYAQFQQKRFRRLLGYGDERSKPRVDSELKSNNQTKPPLKTRFSESRPLQTTSPGYKGNLPIIYESAVSPKFKDIPEVETLSNFSSDSDYRQPALAENLKRFLCSEKVRYLGEFNIESDSDSGSSDEEEEEIVTKETFGQEFYLGNIKKQEYATYEEMLQNRKFELSNLRAFQRMQFNKCNLNKKGMLPELSESDMYKSLAHAKFEIKKPEYEKVPTFEEYLRYLKRGVKKRYDQMRISKADRKNVRGVRELKTQPKKKRPLIKEVTERFGDEVWGLTNSVPCKLHCYDTDAYWKSLRSKTKRNYLANKSVARKAEIAITPKENIKKQPDEERKLIIPQIYLTTVTGITYLHPVSKSIFQKHRQNEVETVSEKMTENLTERSTSPSSVKTDEALHGCTKDKSVFPKSVSGLKKESAEASGKDEQSLPKLKSCGKRMFPKAQPLVKGTESPDNLSDDESDDLDESNFDTNKLNKSYSIDKIKQMLKDRREKIKGTMFNRVLKKYLHLKTVINAFSKSSKTSQWSGYSAYHIYRLKKMIKHKVTFHEIKPKEETDIQAQKIEDEPFTIGKLRHFNFLDTSRKPTPVQEIIHSDPVVDDYPIEDFRLNTMRALEEFVVRREIVVSNTGSKKSLSVTFTRKSVFTNNKYSCH